MFVCTYLAMWGANLKLDKVSSSDVVVKKSLRAMSLVLGLAATYGMAGTFAFKKNPDILRLAFEL